MSTGDIERSEIEAIKSVLGERVTEEELAYIEAMMKKYAARQVAKTAPN